MHTVDSIAMKAVLYLFQGGQSNQAHKAIVIVPSATSVGIQGEAATVFDGQQAVAVIHLGPHDYVTLEQ